MFELNLQNIVIVILVAVVIYLVYTKMEGFAEAKKHHGHKHHEHKHEHSVKEASHPWNRLPNWDFGGYDIYHMPGKSVDECEKLCGDLPLCTHTTFNGTDTCWLKTPNGLQGHYVSGFTPLKI